MEYWILPWKTTKFDLHGCLQEFGFVEWRQINKLNVGDIIFLYCTKPIGQILYMFQVSRINIPFNETVNDSFFTRDKWDPKPAKVYARFEPISVADIHNPELSFEKLVQLGMKKNLQMGIRAKGVLLEHLLKHFDVVYNAYSKKFQEGDSSKVLITSYERNPQAKEECIKHYNNDYTCRICGFNFEKKYGALGKNFIHVHHIKFISSFEGEKHEIDPSKDLLPVCPNCHAMLHRKINGSFLTPQELKKMLNN